MQTLAEGLGSGALPSLTFLLLFRSNIGELGAVALAAALSRGALPRLSSLNLAVNAIGSAGPIALAPALRARPQLERIEFNMNGIGDDGVAAFLAPGEGVLQSLEVLDLHNNQVTDTGCLALVAALSSGTVPIAEAHRLAGRKPGEQSGEGGCRRGACQPQRQLKSGGGLLADKLTHQKKVAC
eukprot:2656782-Prymnesium_polylepis.1